MSTISGLSGSVGHSFALFVFGNGRPPGGLVPSLRPRKSGFSSSCADTHMQ